MMSPSKLEPLQRRRTPKQLAKRAEKMASRALTAASRALVKESSPRLAIAKTKVLLPNLTTGNVDVVERRSWQWR